MRVGEWPLTDLSARLAGTGISFASGPFVVRVVNNNRTFTRDFSTLYAHHPLHAQEEVEDCHIRLLPPWGIRRFLRRQVLCQVDGRVLFHPYPHHLAMPVFEWGLNQAIATRAHQYLILHAACVESRGQAWILAGSSGAGKSTLCAALVGEGWRLLSDELTLIDTDSGQAAPLARPISLKNDAIPHLRDHYPHLSFGPLYPDTRKGAVSHVVPPQDSVTRMAENAMPALVLFPEFIPGTTPLLSPLPRVQGAFQVAGHALNYDLLGEVGFRTLTGMMAKIPCLTFRYGHLRQVPWLLAELGMHRG